MIEWWGPILYEYYSGTEGPGTCAITSEQWLEHPGSVGPPVIGEVHIVDDDGVECPTGQVGSIYFSGGPTFSYHNDAEKTTGALNDQGWATLGDVGYLDDDGYLYLTDRKAFTIISGGVNIYPQEIEDVLVGHPAVQDVAVFGVPNEDLGEEAKAVVELVDAALAGPETAAMLTDYCREHLASYKLPRSIEFVDKLPRDDTGKLRKRDLRDPYWEGRATAIG
jgi:acyl-CoA synthetase (AMP-forming)/AMP-acid ligase II